MADYQEITKNGLWKNNPAIVQLLGLCPLLAVTGSVVNALGLGLATMLVLIGSNISVSLIRNAVSDAVRLPAFVMIIASFTTCTELLMRAYTFELYQILGIFIPLIVTNCSILGRADAFASKNPLLPSIADGFMMGLGFTLVLVVVGSIREVIGAGTLFDNMHLLFGDVARSWKLNLFGADYKGFLVAILPPGAFLVVGALIAVKNVIDSEMKRREEAKKPAAVKGSKRVRTTGTIA
ncbi:electron transport complex subunit E [Teredinibacter sp. KSP-S5-2]|uniref:electron transport complex subunit E n=1 Tax=Teredinibacter sp. KSP-S5-2 TaxID=3034506 RepID=UPI0029344916|nr:electron transport complex subunit E [Teredinibacter sp. KSP-S5-2]WNO10245.1 electron transport complex subunit E [Teredinibacter sp. KSP-S5-2]